MLENDLVTTGYFSLLKLEGPQLRQAAQDRAAGKPDAGAWAAWGAELLLGAEAARRDGRLVLRASLSDTGAGSRILTHEESDTPEEAAGLAHRLADAVLRALTGSPSLALTRVVATWSRSPGSKRVALMDYDGRNLRAISPEGVLALHPAWFPDRTRVAYVTYRQGRPEIVSQNVTTGQVRSLAFFPGLNASPAISPDGRQMLLVLSRDGNPEVYRMAVDGSELKRLTFTPAVETSPVWSPDGSQIALVSDQGGGPQVHLLGASGGRMRRVSFAGNYATSPDWSPRGDRIVFTALVEGDLPALPSRPRHRQPGADHLRRGAQGEPVVRARRQARGLQRRPGRLLPADGVRHRQRRAFPRHAREGELHLPRLVALRRGGIPWLRS